MVEAIYGRILVKRLVDRFLINFDQQGKLTMHDQLRDLGRDIVFNKGEARVLVGLRSHIWEPAVARQLFDAKVGEYGTCMMLDNLL
jgi:hypothetical protein